jgi:hypothetical protein
MQLCCLEAEPGRFARNDPQHMLIHVQNSFQTDNKGIRAKKALSPAPKCLHVHRESKCGIGPLKVPLPGSPELLTVALVPERSPKSPCASRQVPLDENE